MDDFDVIVAGAGPGGCIAARDLARRGFRVGLFDAGTEGRIAKTIVVEVERDAFSDAGLEAPSGDLVAYTPERVRFLSPRGKTVCVFDALAEGFPVAIFLDRFVGRLLDDAMKAGAAFHVSHRAAAVIFEKGRAVGARFEHGGRSEEARARVIIDATGFSGSLVRSLPFECGMRIEDDPGDVVIAENRLHHINEKRAAEVVRRGVHRDGEVWSRVAEFGSYSTVYSYLSTDAGTAYILIGLKKANRIAPPVGAAIDHFIEQQGYYGEKIQAGGGPIRIRRSLDRLVTDGFMAIGEAACTVVPVHGSGVASSMHTGRIAAMAAARALENGDVSTRALWPCAALYQRGRGRALAGLDVVRMSVDRMSVNDAVALLESGVMHRDDVRGGILARAPSIAARTIPFRIPGLLRRPNLVFRLAQMGITLQKVLAHYARYPSTFDARTFELWASKNAKLFATLN